VTLAASVSSDTSARLTPGTRSSDFRTISGQEAQVMFSTGAGLPFRAGRHGPPVGEPEAGQQTGQDEAASAPSKPPASMKPALSSRRIASLSLSRHPLLASFQPVAATGARVIAMPRNTTSRI